MFTTKWKIRINTFVNSYRNFVKSTPSAINYPWLGTWLSWRIQCARAAKLAVEVAESEREDNSIEVMSHNIARLYALRDVKAYIDSPEHWEDTHALAMGIDTLADLCQRLLIGVINLDTFNTLRLNTLRNLFETFPDARAFGFEDPRITLVRFMVVSRAISADTGYTLLNHRHWLEEVPELEHSFWDVEYHNPSRACFDALVKESVKLTALEG